MPQRGTEKKPAFSGIDDPRIPRSITRLSAERQQAWVNAENERWLIVETCKVCKRGLVAHEVEPHRLSHIKNTRARQIIGMILSPRTNAEALAEVQDFLAKNG